MQALAQALGRFSTATLFEAAGKVGDMSPAIRPIVAGAAMAGIARTLRVWPGDTLGVLRLIETAPAGSVLVIDAGASGRAAVWGGTSAIACVARRIAGCVTNGCVRDTRDIVELGFPTFAAGISPRGTVKHHAGWPGVPVSVGDIVVCDGDIIVGDDDGVLVIEAARAEAILPLAEAQASAEAVRDARVRAGEALSIVLRLPS